MDGCNHSIIEFSNYFEHLLRTHKTIGGREDSDDTFIIRQTFTESTKTRHNWLCTYKKFDGKVFLTRSFKQGPLFHWSLSMIGSDSEARKYAVKITIDREDEQVPKFELTIPVISIRKTKQEVEENCLHAVLPEKVLRFFCTVKFVEDKKQFQWRTQYKIIKEMSCHLESFPEIDPILLMR
ncbi:unnamed protein product [Allacma fusca]|uniref:Uncharacterized protein n=1 Tax=Allacma fusca TaxID=39272 RepID=A0A8J2KDR2_9HEXA|nr:unnamed protein product [Allacma fusca]